MRDKIDKILESSNDDLVLGIDDTFIDRIALKNKADYVNSTGNKKQSFWNQVAGTLLAIWFLILPFVALGLMIHLAFVKTTPLEPKLKIQNCLQSPFQ